MTAQFPLVTEAAHIDGQWVTGTGGTFDVLDPADGSLLATLPECGAAEARAAIDAAAAALPAWRSRTAKDRASVLRRWHDLLIAHVEELGALITAECGKPLAEAIGEVRYGASFIEWFAEEGKRTYGEVIPSPFPTGRVLVLRQPIGVAAAITPWNFPLAMLTRKVGPALAAGCTTVIKPAEDTPLTTLAAVELAMQAGVPAGVLNVVTAADPRGVGGELTSNPAVRKLSFTGSTEVGKLLMQQCAGTVKKLSLELGGNAPFIVFPDADIDAAVVGAIASKYRNAGQTCVCANRMLVHDAVYDEFAAKLAGAVAQLVVGPGARPGVQIGPLINADGVAKVERLVADARDKGAEVLTGGARHELGGNFFQPTVISGIDSTMSLASEEIFGPVSPLFRFSSDDEAIAIANGTPFGLAAYFYARDLGRVFRIAEALEYGMVAVNEGILSTEVAPFGGVKESGLGREGSRHGIDEYLEMKYLLLGGI
jgi:succinate-semialdehyde dehydrogenase/glutarate-semialdehyde dehydrogenase